MASRDYCSNVAEELEFWSEKLHNLSDKINRIPSIDKQRLLPQIEDLHIIMTELDDRLCDLLTACPTTDGPGKGEFFGTRDKDLNFIEEGKEKFDYDFGG